MYQGVSAYLDKTGSYEQIPSISIDYAVAEKSMRLKAIPLDVTWSDVGNLREFLAIQHKCNAEKRGTVIKIDSEQALVHSQAGKAVVLIDLNDVCVVDTPDALVISRKDSVEKVKSARAQLVAQNERYG